jgi:hypothetical protein
VRIESLGSARYGQINAAKFMPPIAQLVPPLQSSSAKFSRTQLDGGSHLESTTSPYKSRCESGKEHNAQSCGRIQLMKGGVGSNLGQYMIVKRIR